MEENPSMSGEKASLMELASSPETPLEVLADLMRHGDTDVSSIAGSTMTELFHADRATSVTVIESNDPPQYEFDNPETILQVVKYVPTMTWAQYEEQHGDPAEYRRNFVIAVSNDSEWPRTDSVDFSFVFADDLTPKRTRDIRTPMRAPEDRGPSSPGMG